MRLLSLLIAIGSASSSVPPTAKSYTTVGNVNSPQVIKLRTNTIIEDNGEITWPIFVADDFTVKEIKIIIHGLFHEYASDLSFKVIHGTKEALLFSHVGGNKVFGKPFPHPHPDVAGLEYPTPHPVDGTGYDYSFQDLSGYNNIAIGKTATQSSTLYGGAASRAIDGNTNGFYSASSVTHTDGHATTDPQPWWQVDLGANFVIGTVKVWNRVQQPNYDTVQKVTTTGAGKIGGYFRLSVNHGGMIAVTTPIAYNAVGSIADEVVPGSSLQAKLEALDNVGVVSITRGPLDTYTGGYTWTVTFVGDPGTVSTMTIGENALSGPSAVATVVTITSGSTDIYTNYETPVHEVSDRVKLGWVMVFASGVTIPSSLSAAKAVALFKKQITLGDMDSEEIDIRLPTNTVNGRVVRVQLEESLYLTLAEVQVFQEKAVPLEWYTGGSPIAPYDTYQPQYSFTEAFKGQSSLGEWLLVVKDSTARSSVRDSSSPSYEVHGQGGFDDWELIITKTDGTTISYLPDISATVKTLPIHGKLYYYDAAQPDKKGSEVQVAAGLNRNEGRCYENCEYQWQVGNGLSTTKYGSGAAYNRIPGYRYVVYVPNSKWIGRDIIAYTISNGVDESSSWGEINIEVRKCRVGECNNDSFNDIQFYNPY
jgi:hypothetical protein